MRHYVPQKNNPYALPHNVYMQMLYLIRDYYERGYRQACTSSGERRWQWQAVEESKRAMLTEYKKRSEACGAFDPLRAFFDYAYFSLMFAQRGRDMGACKRSWNLYRCRWAYLVAENLGLLSSTPGNLPDQ